MNFRLKDGLGMEFLPCLSQKTSYTLLCVTMTQVCGSRNLFRRHKLGHAWNISFFYDISRLSNFLT